MTCVGRNTRWDNHHIFYIKADWCGDEAKRLRNHPYCIVPTPRGLHKRVHAKVEDGVPIPSAFHIKGALRQLDYLLLFGAISERDNIEKRLTTLISIFSGIEQPTADALKAQLGAAQRYRTFNPHLF